MNMMKHIKVLLAVVVCALCVSNAKAALLLDWQNGSRTTQATGVTGASTITYAWTTTGTLAVTLTLNQGYSATGVTGNFTVILAANNSATINGTSYSSGTTTSSSTSFGNLSVNGSTTWNINISALNLNGSHNLTFSDIQFNGTLVPPVPEPIAYALPLFGLVFIGGTAGRAYLARRRQA